MFFLIKSHNLVRFARIHFTSDIKKELKREKYFFPDISQKPFLGNFELNVKNLQYKTPSKGLIFIFIFSKINYKLFMKKISRAQNLEGVITYTGQSVSRDNLCHGTICVTGQSVNILKVNAQ